MNAQTEALLLRTKQFALRVIRLHSSLPKSDSAQIMGKQLLRSGTSVGANYREAVHARSKAEFTAKLGDCLKEISESSYWLELLSESKTLAPEKLEALMDESKQLASIFYAIIRNTKKNSAPPPENS